MYRNAKPMAQVPLCNQVLLVNDRVAELAAWALRVKGFSRKRPPTRRGGGYLGILLMFQYIELRLQSAKSGEMVFPAIGAAGPLQSGRVVRPPYGGPAA